jgi:hypothetical protein
MTRAAVFTALFRVVTWYLMVSIEGHTIHNLLLLYFVAAPCGGSGGGTWGIEARSVSAIRKRSRDHINKETRTVFLREILVILLYLSEQKCSAEYSRNNGIFFDFLHPSVVAVHNVSNLSRIITTCDYRLYTNSTMLIHIS